MGKNEQFLPSIMQISGNMWKKSVKLKGQTGKNRGLSPVILWVICVKIFLGRYLAKSYMMDPLELETIS